MKARIIKDFNYPHVWGWFNVKPCPSAPFHFVCLAEPYTQEWLSHSAFIPEMTINRKLLEFKRD